MKRLLAVVLAASALVGCSAGSAPISPVLPSIVSTAQAPEHAPTAEGPDPLPTVTVTGGYTCKDGSVSHARHRRGACSHHGGIA